MRPQSAVMLACLASQALLADPAAAALRVVATTPTLASIAKEIGGDRVDVRSLAVAGQDPHSIEPKPSFSLELNHADLLVHVGLGFEMHWLPAAILDARNSGIRDGEVGNLDCSQAVRLLDAPGTQLDASYRDNSSRHSPYYWLSPANAKAIAQQMARRLGQLDADGRGAYQERLATFISRADALEHSVPGNLRGSAVATSRRTWSYLSDWLGLREVGYVEPRAGFPPTHAQAAQLVAAMRADQVRMLLIETYYEPSAAQLVAQRSGATLVTLPRDVGAAPEAPDWFKLMETILHRLEEARPDK